MEAIETIEKDGFVLKLYPDEDPGSPREWDNVGTMVCWHPHYNLGDVNGQKEYGNPDEFMTWWQANGKGGVILPLYLYDHSGITMSTDRSYPFNCPWDSGQIGWIYATAEKIHKEWKCNTKATRAKALKCLQTEVETYDQFLTGQIYGYVIEDQQGEHVDSCWGFYGFDYCKQEAEAQLAYWIKEYIERNTQAQKDMAL